MTASKSLKSWKSLTLAAALLFSAATPALQADELPRFGTKDARGRNEPAAKPRSGAEPRAGAEPRSEAERKGGAIAPDADGIYGALEDLGYEVEDVGNDELLVEIEVATDAGNVNAKVLFSLSPSKRYLWVWARFGPMPEGSIEVERMLKLLETNAGIQPAHFYVVSLEDGPELRLGLPLEIASLTPERLDEAIDGFCGAIGDSRGLWDHTRWGKPARRSGKSKKSR